VNYETENLIIGPEIQKMYSLKELEPILELSSKTLQQYIRDGRLKAVKIGNKWKVSERNLTNFMNGD